jgi:hypothetical protein
MPDWQEVVRQNLAGLRLNAAEKNEVHTELAVHLEETYEALLRAGIPEADAIQRALSLAGDWQDLRRRIQTARTKESTMLNRVRQLWLPGLLTLFTAMSLLMLIQFFGPYPLILHRSGWSMVAPVMVIYVPWLLSLPLIGALGAYLSNRADASQRMVLTSILFPVLPYLTFFLIGFPVVLIVDGHVTHNVMSTAFFAGLFAWVLLPGAALLSGGLPVQLLLSRRSNARGVGSH